jgi:hypothetical protein
MKAALKKLTKGSVYKSDRRNANTLKKTFGSFSSDWPWPAFFACRRDLLEKAVATFCTILGV